MATVNESLASTAGSEQYAKKKTCHYSCIKCNIEEEEEIPEDVAKDASNVLVLGMGITRIRHPTFCAYIYIPSGESCDLWITRSSNPALEEFLDCLIFGSIKDQIR